MQLLKDIVLILVFLVVILMFATLIVTIFLAKVPFVPTKKSILPLLESVLPRKKGQIFIDMGAGDGKVLRWAEKQLGARAIGYEIAPLPLVLGKLINFFSGSKSKLLAVNFFKQDISNADLVFCYLFPELTEEVFNKVKADCCPGTLFICNTFKPKNIKPAKIVYDKKNKAQFYLYQI